MYGGGAKGVCVYHGACAAFKTQCAGDGSLLPLCRSLGSNLDHQAWCYDMHPHILIRHTHNNNNLKITNSAGTQNISQRTKNRITVYTPMNCEQSSVFIMRMII